MGFVKGLACIIGCVKGINRVDDQHCHCKECVVLDQLEIAWNGSPVTLQILSRKVITYVTSRCHHFLIFFFEYFPQHGHLTPRRLLGPGSEQRAWSSANPISGGQQNGS